MREAQAPESSVSASVCYFDSEKTRAGDVMLNTDPESWLSSKIRAATGAPFSHAAICTETSHFVEAIGLGVHRLLLEIMAVEQPDAVRFLRLRDDYPNAQQIGVVAGRKAENYLSQPYWHLGMSTALMPELGLNSGGRFFCSHLVAQAYREAGVDLVAGREPHKVTPGDLLQSPLFQDITAQIVLPPGPRARWRPARPMERGGGESPHDREIALAQKIHQRIVGVFRSLGLPEPENFLRAVAALGSLSNKTLAAEIDKDFLTVLREENYLGLADLAREKMASALSQPELVVRILQKGEWSRQTIADALAQSRRIQSLLERSVEDHAHGLEGFRRKLAETGLGTFALLAELYRRQLELGEAGLVSLSRTIELLEEALS